MQVTITANALKSMLPGFAKVLSSRNHIPALECARIEKAASGEVTLAVTNLTESLAYSLPPETQTTGDGHGTFLCSVAELKKAAAGLKKDDKLVLTPNGDEAVRITTFTSGQAITREIGSIAASEFPSDLWAKKIQGAPCNVGEFLDGFRTAMVAASADTTRVALNAVCADPANAALVGTDGRRMMQVKLTPFPLKSGLVIPLTKVLANGILDSAEGFIGAGHAGSTDTLEIRAAPWRYTVRCPDVNYPNYKQVIPADNRDDAEFVFAEADIPLLKTAVSQLNGGGDVNCVALFADADGMALFSVKPDGDKQFPFVRLTGGSRATSNSVLQALNADFLLDAINAGFRNVRAPQRMAPLKFTLPQGGESVYVLMPMNTITRELRLCAHQHFPASVPDPDAPVVEAAKETTTTVPEPETDNKEKETMKSNTQTAQTTTAEAESAPGSAGAPTGTRMSEDAAEAVVPPVMQFPASGADPLQELLSELNAAQDTALDTLNRLKAIRQKARNVERHYRGKAKEIEAKSQLIAKFQKAVSL